MEARKDRKEREKLSNAEKGVVGDVDFVRMISAWRKRIEIRPRSLFFLPMKPRRTRVAPFASVFGSDHLQKYA